MMKRRKGRELRLSHTENIWHLDTMQVLQRWNYYKTEERKREAKNRATAVNNSAWNYRSQLVCEMWNTYYVKNVWLCLFFESGWNVFVLISADIFLSWFMIFWLCYFEATRKYIVQEYVAKSLSTSYPNPGDQIWVHVQVSSHIQVSNKGSCPSPRESRKSNKSEQESTLTYCNFIFVFVDSLHYIQLLIYELLVQHKHNFFLFHHLGIT